MMVLEAMALEACRIFHNQLPQHPRGHEGEDHGGCGRGRWPRMPGDLLRMVAERPADLPWEHGIPEPPHHGAHRHGGKPFGVLQPHRTDGGGIRDPANAWCDGERWRLIGLA